MRSSSSRNQDSSHESSGDQQPSDVREESMNGEEMSASDPGLDWFLNLTSPAEGDSAFPASPIRSSRQYNAANALCSSVLPSNKGSAHRASAWEKQAGEGGGSVVQKTSKAIRTKRLKEMNAERGKYEGTDGVGSNADQASSPHELPRHSTPTVDRKRPSEGKAASFSPAVMEQPESKSLQVELSSFTFRPRERMTHLDQTSGSEPSPETNITHHKIGTERIMLTKQGEKKEREQKRRSESPAEGSSACKKLLIQPEVGETRSEKSRERNVTAGDTENKRQQLVNSLRSVTPKEPDRTAPPHHPKPKVASSTLAKLSAFSFVPPPEENASHDLTAAPAQANKTPVSKDGGVMEADAAEHKGSKNSATEACQKTSRPHARTETCEEQAARFSKRKCFELSSARPGTLFSGLSFFSSSVLEDEAPDVDWE